MKTIFWIRKAELQSLFCTPIAWILLLLFALQTGFIFVDSLSSIVRSQELRYPVGFITSELFSGRTGVFPNVLKYIYLYIPLLSMGLISREYSSGSIKLLYSAPVKPYQIVLGKYLAILTVALIMIGILFLQVGVAWCTVSSFDIKMVAVGLLGIFLLIAVYAAIGLFMSCLTSYQMVAAIGTLGILALLNFIGKVAQGTDFIRDLTYWLSVSGRAENFVKGVVLSKDVVYFIAVVILFLSWSILKLESERRQNGVLRRFISYTVITACIVLIGYISSRPSWVGFYDATRVKANTLSAASQEILKNIPGELRITTYVNMLDADYNVALPKSRNSDLSRFDKYRYAKPEIMMDYTYYYMPTTNPSLDRRYPGMPAKDRAKELSKVYDINFDKLIAPDSIVQNEDLRSEQYHFVRVIEHIPTGKKAYLRLFDDASRHPSEAELSIVLKRMVMDMPVVGFLSGFNGRDSRGDGDRHYNRFAREKGFRFSLVNQGFDAADVTLDEPLDSAITILVIADIRRDFSAVERANLQQYIDRGGNVVIAAEPQYGALYLNGILSTWGIELDTATLSQPDDSYSHDLIMATLTPSSFDMSHYYDVFKRSPRVVTMPGACVIKYDRQDARIKPILTVATDSLTGKEGVEDSLITGVIATRPYQDQTQKIVVLSDADCLSNAEISMRRKGVRAANFTFVTGLFNWLSDGLAPLDTRGIDPQDIHLDMDSSGLSIWSFVFRFGIALAIGVAGAVLLLVRRRR